MLKKTSVKKYVLLIFFIFFICLTLFGGSGISLAINGVSPILALCLLVPFASFFPPIPSAVMGFLCCVWLFGFGGFEDRAGSFEYRKVAFGRDVDYGLVVEVRLLTHPEVLDIGRSQ